TGWPGFCRARWARALRAYALARVIFIGHLGGRNQRRRPPTGSVIPAPQVRLIVAESPPGGKSFLEQTRLTTVPRAGARRDQSPAGAGSAMAGIERKSMSVVGSCPCRLTGPFPSRQPLRGLSLSGRLSVQSTCGTPLTQVAMCRPCATTVIVNHSLSLAA